MRSPSDTKHHVHHTPPDTKHHDARTARCVQEHMLFMGSTKYPSENEYDDFITKHGGSANAYTELVGAEGCGS